MLQNYIFPITTPVHGPLVIGRGRKSQISRDFRDEFAEISREFSGQISLESDRFSADLTNFSNERKNVNFALFFRNDER